MAFRADLEPSSPLVPAALTIAGVLGGTPSSRFFKVVRETHGLCYYASAGWARAKGLLIVQSGIEPKNEPRVRRLVLSLLKETASGRLDSLAHEAYLAQARTRVEAMRDDRGAALSFAQEMTALGLTPRPETHLARLAAVTKADVRKAGRRIGLEASFFLTPKGSAA
jgi:predicted Zn-dependent peptidase